MEHLVEKIVKLEWEFFGQTKNQGGRASCQEDWETFQIMRGGQFSSWTEELRESYYKDLLDAKAAGRNLITEKYGRMMESTDKEEYEKIKEYFPVISKERKAIAEQIIMIQVGWLEEFADNYPNLAGQARHIHTSEDTPYDTSAETYLRGELDTYSENTFLLYGRYVAELQKSGKNLTAMINEYVVKKYGYADLEAAEKKMSQQQKEK